MLRKLGVVGTELYVGLVAPASVGCDRVRGIVEPVTKVRWIKGGLVCYLDRNMGKWSEAPFSVVTNVYVRMGLNGQVHWRNAMNILGVYRKEWEPGEKIDHVWSRRKDLKWGVRRLLRRLNHGDLPQRTLPAVSAVPRSNLKAHDEQQKPKGQSFRFLLKEVASSLKQLLSPLEEARDCKSAEALSSLAGEPGAPTPHVKGTVESVLEMLRGMQDELCSLQIMVTGESIWGRARPFAVGQSFMGGAEISFMKSSSSTKPAAAEVNTVVNKPVEKEAEIAKAAKVPVRPGNVLSSAQVRDVVKAKASSQGAGVMKLGDFLPVVFPPKDADPQEEKPKVEKPKVSAPDFAFDSSVREMLAARSAVRASQVQTQEYYPGWLDDLAAKDKERK